LLRPLPVPRKSAITLTGCLGGRYSLYLYTCKPHTRHNFNQAVFLMIYLAVKAHRQSRLLHRS
jgi:hypothetical protein